MSSRYADPAMCKCLYVGTPAQYQCVLEKRLANEQLVAQQEHLNDDAVMGPLGSLAVVLAFRDGT